VSEEEALKEEILRILKERNLVCTGSCYLKRPDELHCVDLAQMLGTNQGVIWRLIRELMAEGRVLRTEVYRNGRRINIFKPA